MDEGLETLHIALAGGETDAVLDGFLLHPATRVILLYRESDRAHAQKLRRRFSRAGISVDLHRFEGHPYLGTLQALNEIVVDSRLTHDEIWVNVSSGCVDAGCAATTAAYLHGLKAFMVAGDAAPLMPVLPVDQRATLTDADVAVLRALGTSPLSLARLARVAGLRTVVVRARVHGEPDHQGLVSRGLVHMPAPFSVRRRIRLSLVGEALLASGFIS